MGLPALQLVVLTIHYAPSGGFFQVFSLIFENGSAVQSNVPGVPMKGYPQSPLTETVWAGMP
jgi:hypothetical protein